MRKNLWGYASWGTLALHDIKTGESLSSKEVTGIVVNRRDYTLDIVSVPRGTSEETRKILEYKIKELHPAPSQTVFDWVVMRHGRLQTLAVIIFQKELLEKYRNKFPDKPLTILLQWFDEKQQGNELHPFFWQQRGENELFKISDNVIQPFQGAAENCQSFPIKQKPPAGLFQPVKNRFFKEGPGWNILSASAALLSLVLFLVIQSAQLQETSVGLKKDYSRLMEEKSRILQLQKEIEELSIENNKRNSAEYRNMTHTLGEIINILPPGTIIDQLEADQSSFRIRLRSTSPLTVIKDFNESLDYMNLESSGIKEIQGSNQSIFTLSGDFNG